MTTTRVEPSRPAARARVRAARAASAALGLAAALGWPAPALAVDEQEQRERILFETREMEKSVEKRLYGDPALDAYLQSIVERLFPENHERFRVRAYRDPEFNAFAVASGNLYVNVGALLRMRNEAELASVLGHEGGHVLADHVYRGTVNARTMSVLGTVLSAGITAVIGFDPALGALASYSTMAGFSRDYEREADRIGFERMAKAGYDPGAAAPVFARMAQEVTDRKVKQGPYFFASHPALQERARNFAEFAAGAPPGETRRDEYLAATRGARLDALGEIYERKDGRALVAVLGGDIDLAELGPGAEFMLGEGYRLRGDPGDEERALEQYRRSIAAHPDFGAAWGALGRWHARRGEKELALEHLEKFVALSPNAREAGFARQSIERLKKELGR